MDNIPDAHDDLSNHIKPIGEVPTGDVEFAKWSEEYMKTFDHIGASINAAVKSLDKLTAAGNDQERVHALSEYAKLTVPIFHAILVQMANMNDLFGK